MEKLMFYIHSGGPIVYILIALNCVGMTIVMWKLLTFKFAKKKLANTAKSIFKGINSESSKMEEGTLLELVRDRVYSLTSRLEKGLATIKIIATIAPLLGLLGTVAGVLSSFQVIAQEGLKDPTLFAAGISMALITTAAGLIVAIPHFISYNYLIAWITGHEVDLTDEILVKHVNKGLGNVEA